MPRLTANGLNIHVQQAGSGPDVVLIHGLTGDLSIWFLSGTIPAMAETHRVTAYDLRGHGYTDAPAEGYTSLDHARDLIGLLDVLGIARARLVGHSFGAVIAVHAAVIASERIDALVLSDPYFPALRHLEDVSQWGHWQNFCREAEDAGVTLSSDTWYDLTTFFDQVRHLDDERLLRFRQAVGLPGLKRVLRLAGTTCGRDSKLADGLSAEQIAGVLQPCLALYGANSPFLTTADYLIEHLPDCRGRRIPDALHRAPEENPEGFVVAVREFLESLQPAENCEVCQ
ncbi:MAG: alpha/beta fold hydrolase [Isosphaeraceae bacterium]